MPRLPVKLAALIGLLALFCGAAVADDDVHRGDGTAYSGKGEKDKTGKNSCQFEELDETWEKYYAALPSQVFDREGDCGRCILVRGLNEEASGKWVKAMVVDECASCGGNSDVDLSIDALNDATGFSWDRKPIEWKWTSCDDGDDKKRRKDRRLLWA